MGGSTTTIDSGIQYVPPGTETLVYDADGNLIQDHRFYYLYDAENRLAKVSLVNPTVSSPSLSYNYIYTYYYDGLSRLVAKRTDMNFNPSTPYWIYMEAFVYDGWNLVLSGKSGNGYASGPPANPITSSSRMHYVWGPDIGSGCSGHDSWQTAGGVGGLIFVNGATDSVRQFPLMDRMGNVTGYRRAVSGSAAVLDAVFEYDAFGREVSSTGPASNTMPFRFSTKATDVDTGLVYYGYRFYDSERGRWLNRDPLAEVGGNNLYSAVRNSPIYLIDVLGRSPLLLRALGASPPALLAAAIAATIELSWTESKCYCEALMYQIQKTADLITDIQQLRNYANQGRDLQSLGLNGDFWTPNLMPIGSLGGRTPISDEELQQIRDAKVCPSCNGNELADKLGGFRDDFESLTNVAGWLSAAGEGLMKTTTGGDDNETRPRDEAIQYWNHMNPRMVKFLEQLVKEYAHECYDK